MTISHNKLRIAIRTKYKHYPEIDHEKAMSYRAGDLALHFGKRLFWLCFLIAQVPLIVAVHFQVVWVELNLQLLLHLPKHCYIKLCNCLFE